MSQLVDQAIDAAGLSALAQARRAGTMTTADASRLRNVDLLALGALADQVRRAEVGDTVRIYLHRCGESSGLHPAGEVAVVLPPSDVELTGLELLREVAIARVTGSLASAVRVDWTSCGLELAQVTLGFGANELAGQITSKRGLPLAESELLGVGKKSLRQLAHVQKRRELAALVRRAGRAAVFVEADGSLVADDEAEPLQEADAV
jgi:2-iminoacetate synthase ThiH